MMELKKRLSDEELKKLIELYNDAKRWTGSLGSLLPPGA